ncbi:hypothetical protein RRG08_015590 [Elysia crispata]|uniref:Uncharacterized protein n=1 Tax=Elysia crispata TaxID=231223 RepID=A0AAE1CX72_9GAST|nr:hypothetical protein RRG08_015590 [Elysia crispata]
MRRNSLYLDFMSSGMDALHENDWALENNHINAPLRLIPKILNILDQYQAVATMIAPLIKAQTFYNKLVERLIAYPDSHKLTDGAYLSVKKHQNQCATQSGKYTHGGYVDKRN